MSEEQRTEGWGNVINSRSAHYFRNNTSLCGKWLAVGGPRWEDYQGLGPEPKRGSGTCLPCWRKRVKEERMIESKDTLMDREGRHWLIVKPDRKEAGR